MKYKWISINSIKRQGTQIELPGLNETRLQLQLTNICNANCTFCAYGKLGKRYQGMMPDDIFQKGVGQFLKAGGKDFGLNSTVGDPLVDKNIVEKIKSLRNRSPGGHIYFFTNLLFLDDFDIDEFLTSGLDLLNISTTAFDKEIYHRLFGSPHYDRFYKNLTVLLKRNDELNNPVKIGILFKLDISPLKAFNLKDFLKLTPYMENVSIDASHKYDNWNGIVTEEYLSGKMKFNKPLVINFPCHRIVHPSIDINGNVIVCSCRIARVETTNPLIIGNINENPLDRIWKGKKHLELFNSFFKKKSIPELCKDCSFYTPYIIKK